MLNPGPYSLEILYGERWISFGGLLPFKNLEDAKTNMKVQTSTATATRVSALSTETAPYSSVRRSKMRKRTRATHDGNRRFGGRKPGLCPVCGKFVDYLYLDPYSGIEVCHKCKSIGDVRRNRAQ